MNTSITVALITSGASAIAAGASAVWSAAQNSRARQAQRQLEEHKARLRELELAGKYRREDRRTLNRFREPLLLAAHDLGDRISNIRCGGLLNRLGSSPHRDQLILRGTAFRIAQYLAMVELLSPQLGSTLANADTDSQEVSRLLRDISRAFATAELDVRPGAEGPRFMLWREEQRAIGELMLTPLTESSPQCLGFAAFLDRYPHQFESWFGPFVEDLCAPGAAESERLAQLHVMLLDLVRHLDSERVYVRTDPDDPQRVIGPRWMVSAGTD